MAAPRAEPHCPRGKAVPGPTGPSWAPALGRPGPASPWRTRHGGQRPRVRGARSPEAPVPWGLGLLTAASCPEWGELQEERLPFLALHGDGPPQNVGDLTGLPADLWGVGSAQSGPSGVWPAPAASTWASDASPWPLRAPLLCPEASCGSRQAASPQVCTGDRDSRTCHSILLNKVISVPRGTPAPAAGRVAFSLGRAAPSCGVG